MKNFTILIIVGAFFCSELQSEKHILVKINDKVLTKNDFIKRSEYTIRPNYCKSDNNIHKKIILNSLIAEKLMAIDIENNLLDNNYSSAFLDGIKEQAMREFLLKDEVYDFIIIDSLKIENHYKNSTKTYNIDFLSFDNDSISVMVSDLIINKISFDAICSDYLNLKDIPNRTIGYFDEYDPIIHEALFSKKLKINEVLGPIYSKDNKVLFIRVVSWNDKPAITNDDRIDQFKTVEQKLYENEFNKQYDLYISNIMKGLELTLFEKPFFILAEKAYNDLILKKDINLKNGLDSTIYLNTPLLTLNETVYTIGDINHLIEKHPLVFRVKDISKRDFPLQFKYALVDLIRDEKLNHVAYSKNYDSNPKVLDQLFMFKDAALSNLHLQAILKGYNISLDEFNKNYYSVIENNINSYIDSLQQKYSSIIEINFDLFDEINLTHIDLYAYRSGVPYPYVVPSFPILTTKHEINYGKKINF